MRTFALGALILAFATSALAQEQASHWVQLAPGGGQEARVLTTAPSCPSIDIDGAPTPMTQRAAPNDYFPLRLCALAIPAKAKKAMLGSEALPLMTKVPQRIMVFGDTGCRIKGGT